MNRLFNLHYGEQDKEKVLENVRQGISFSGANVWILACAIMVASIGLNVNSTAVVIGAMLISPLMGPIVGAGFALGMYDFNLLRKSLKNLFVSTMVGLVVSFIYFLLTPFKEAQSEILARTTPNIYDVLIAFFGGLVGVIAVTRVEKGNPVAGVAIATALMPPLCTAGYGLAIGEFGYFAGALFLYAINCVFICIATFVMVKYLRYPAVGLVDNKKASSVRNWITFITLLMIVPSVYFAYRFVQQQRFYEKVSRYIQQEYEHKGNTIIYRKTYYSSNPRRIELAFLTRRFTAEQIRAEQKKLEDFGIENTRIVIRQDSAFLAKATRIENNEAAGEASRMAELNALIERYTFKTENLYPEAKAIVPGLSSLSVAKQEILSGNAETVVMPVVVYGSENELSEAQKKTFRQWLKARLKIDTLEVYRRL
ncbi:TIGR00341 family protein [Bergeyella sp. RCAD1439]|uniref:TIGR00341 family protein n=1 Tax=Bergeyella anatis TaxID=3113737 RepID=UPI002E17E7CE|nr:TIGR00341 family protein [Bergeyella sp. RCAD1439]